MDSEPNSQAILALQTAFRTGEMDAIKQQLQELCPPGKSTSELMTQLAENQLGKLIPDYKTKKAALYEAQQTRLSSPDQLALFRAIYPILERMVFLSVISDVSQYTSSGKCVGVSYGRHISREGLDIITNALEYQYIELPESYPSSDWATLNFVINTNKMQGWKPLSLCYAEMRLSSGITPTQDPCLTIYPNIGSVEKLEPFYEALFQNPSLPVDLTPQEWSARPKLPHVIIPPSKP